MKNRFLRSVATAGFLALSMAAPAEDIDLFVQPSTSGTEVPNVLIILDNTGNWTQPFTNEVAALVSTFNALPDNRFRVGLMMFSETGSGDTGNSGAYVRAAVRLIDGATNTQYKALINSFDAGNDKSNSGKLGKTMAEAYYYFAGQAPYAGNNKNKADYAGNIYNPNPAALGASLQASRDVWALPGNALPSKAGSPYVSPVNSGCQKNFIIFISNGAAQDSNSDTSEAAALLSAAASAAGIANSTTTIPLSPSGSQTNVADEWARFMKKTGLGVTTFTLDVDKVTTGQGPGWSELLKSMASVSGGKYFDVSSAADAGDEIKKALTSVFSEIQAVNSVFAAVSLPVSVNTQGTYLNQVFVGMFRPDETKAPRWAGNLKQYKLGYLNGSLKLLDADGNSAISSGGTGFIAECARSYWTPLLNEPDEYWANRPQGACLTYDNSDVSNTPDGNIVEKGAQAYKLRSTTTRTVKTCSPVFNSCTAMTDFNTTNVTPTMLGLDSANTTERDELVSWAFGLNEDAELSKATTVMRPSAHGDVVHSRPVAINFGTDAAPQVVVFYGGNDGILRAVNGNRSASIGTVTAGSELWAFMAPEFYPNIKRIRDNTTPVSYFGVLPDVAAEDEPQIPDPQPKPYGFDGAITAYQDADDAWIYATMRRGGRVVYAFDVTEPAAPALKWKRGCPNMGNDDGCSDGFSGIGQTWSAAKVLKAAGYGSAPVLIMGGGYDTCEDGDPHTCTASTKGNKVYVLNADDGTLLKTLDTDRGVVADLFVVPDSATGMAKHAYVVDLGGNVYRINIGSNAPSDWTITKIASLGGTGTAARKFMFAPDVVESNGQYVLLLGSGDREKPLLGYENAVSVSNYFFMLKDDPSDDGWLASESINCGGNVICLNSLVPITDSTSPTLATVAGKKGWYLALNAKEQVVTSAITIFGTVTFSTHTPATPNLSACTSTLGSACVYNIAYANAASMSASGNRCAPVAGGGLPPSPVAGMVTLDAEDSGTEGDTGNGGTSSTGLTVPFCIGCGEDSPLEGGEPPSPPMASQPKSRVYWYIQQ